MKSVRGQPPCNPIILVTSSNTTRQGLHDCIVLHLQEAGREDGKKRMQIISALVTHRVAPCRHLMFYEAVDQDDRRSIGLAVSPDGKADWQRLDRFADGSCIFADCSSMLLCTQMGKLPCNVSIP